MVYRQEVPSNVLRVFLDIVRRVKKHTPDVDITPNFFAWNNDKLLLADVLSSLSISELCELHAGDLFHIPASRLEAQSFQKNFDLPFYPLPIVGNQSGPRHALDIIRDDLRKCPFAGTWRSN